MVSDSRGSLPFDTYTITEMRCKANKGYELSEPQTIEIRKNGETVKADNTFVNAPYPTLTTLAEHSAKVGAKVTLKDEVTLTGLKENTTYNVTSLILVIMHL